MLYKDGSKGVSIDFNQSYNYFFKAALLGDPQSIYAVAYMKYKGLGCIQNYDTAATLLPLKLATMVSAPETDLP